jgi:hypothetical protein
MQIVKIQIFARPTLAISKQSVVKRRQLKVAVLKWKIVTTKMHAQPIPAILALVFVHIQQKSAMITRNAQLILAIQRLVNVGFNQLFVLMMVNNSFNFIIFNALDNLLFKY